MKNLSVILISIMLLVLAGPALAKKPHPVMAPDTLTVDSCSCDSWVLDDSALESEFWVWVGACDVQWTMPDTSWDTYGASVDFSAMWTVDIVDFSAGSDTELDEYSCEIADFDVGTDEDDDERCTATGVEVIVPDHPYDSTVEFEAKVKGFNNGKNGPKSRDFVKKTATCFDPPTIPEPL